MLGCINQAGQDTIGKLWWMLEEKHCFLKFPGSGGLLVMEAWVARVIAHHRQGDLFRIKPESKRGIDFQEPHLSHGFGWTGGQLEPGHLRYLSSPLPSLPNTLRWFEICFQSPETGGTLAIIVIATSSRNYTFVPMIRVRIDTKNSLLQKVGYYKINYHTGCQFPHKEPIIT